MKQLLKRVLGQRQPLPSPPPVPCLANKYNRVLSLRELGVPIEAVVDVGVLSATSELIQSVPDRHHHLFEPVSSWYQQIHDNYASIPHTLYPVALSDTDGTCWLVQTSLHSDGLVTHSKISADQVAVDGINIVDCSPVEIRRLDSFDHCFVDDFLLKIDIDGEELRVLSGAAACLRRASVVIVEADCTSLADRAMAVQRSGFELIDIVDRVMYGEVLWQCDLVFLRSDLVDERLRPPMFDSRHWHPLP